MAYMDRLPTGVAVDAIAILRCLRPRVFRAGILLLAPIAHCTYIHYALRLTVAPLLSRLVVLIQHKSDSRV